MTPIALTVAGSDSGGGAGIQADLKTFAALGVYGTSVVTALTAQNTQGVRGVHVPPASFLLEQLEAVFTDFDVRAVKVGMLAEAAVIAALAQRVAESDVPVVLDPVMVAKSGDRLLAEDAVAQMREALLPRATVVTPNVPEAAVLLGCPPEEVASEPERAARALLGAYSPKAVLLKGGHLDGEEAVDWLVTPATSPNEAEAGNNVVRYAARRVQTRHTHGTGCTLSSAIAAGLARGLPLRAAVDEAKDYVTRALIAAERVPVGRGTGPLHHFHAWWPSEPR